MNQNHSYIESQLSSESFLLLFDQAEALIDDLVLLSTHTLVLCHGLRGSLDIPEKAIINMQDDTIKLEQSVLDLIPHLEKEKEKHQKTSASKLSEEVMAKIYSLIDMLHEITKKINGSASTLMLLILKSNNNERFSSLLEVLSLYLSIEERREKVESIFSKCVSERSMCVV